MISTLTLVKKMTAAGMPVQQAEVVAELMADTLSENLASKRDIADVQGDIATLRREVQSEITTLRKDMAAGEASIRRDIKDVETKLTSRMDTQIELVEKLFERSQKQTLQVGLGIALGIIAVLGFLFRFLAK